MNKLSAALVIARRDFMATVMSRSFALFLLFPLVIIFISAGLGSVNSRVVREESHPNVAVIGPQAEFAEIQAARERINPAFGRARLPDLVHADPDYVVSQQVDALLQSPSKRISAVLTGGLDHPRLTGDVEKGEAVERQMRAILEEAAQARALRAARIAPAPVNVELVKAAEGEGALAGKRAVTTQITQMLFFMLTLMLATMLLSTVVEEKSNKIIEVLAAAVPVDAIFFGKLLAMLAASLVGISLWTAAAIGASMFFGGGGALPEPAVGWPLFVLLVILYFGMNYLLLGALFLGIGAQATSSREVQTLSMPITISQVLIFMLAGMASAAFNSPIGIAASVFPFSTPLTMIARAAQTREIWPHLLALPWLALWSWVVIVLGAALFRINVFKSGGGSPTAGLLKGRKGR